jgi:hypothetical protein
MHTVGAIIATHITPASALAPRIIPVNFLPDEVAMVTVQRLALSCLLLVCVATPCVAQLPAPTQGPPQRSDQEEKMRREQEKRMNKQRHEDLKKDTDKILELATQLKDYVDKSNENVLSVDVVKKAEEIEKLSRKVKDKMKAY